MQIIRTADQVREQLTSHVRAHDAHVEIDELMAELHRLVSRSERSGRHAVEQALPMAAKLQVARSNVDACNPSRRPGIGGELVALADQRLKFSNTFERSLTYTAETTMRRLTGDL